jgi:hypothetical protein
MKSKISYFVREACSNICMMKDNTHQNPFKSVFNWLELLLIPLICVMMYPDYAGQLSTYRKSFYVLGYPNIRLLVDLAILSVLFYRLYIVFILKKPDQRIWLVSLIYILFSSADLYQTYSWVSLAGLGFPLFILMISPIALWMFRGVVSKLQT